MKEGCGGSVTEQSVWLVVADNLPAVGAESSPAVTGKPTGLKPKESMFQLRRRDKHLAASFHFGASPQLTAGGRTVTSEQLKQWPSHSSTKAERSQRSLDTGIARVHIGPQVVEITNGTFEGCINLVEIQFNERLQVIGHIAFEDCKALRRVTLPWTVVKLGHQAFVDCTNLVEVLFNYGLRVIGDGAFEGCKALRSVTIPSTVTKLGHRAFLGCINLGEVRLKEGLQVIGHIAFEDCKALRSVTIPSTVAKLGHRAFLGCINLGEVRLKEGLQVIGDGAFEGCKALRSMTIPSTVTKLGGLAFQGCVNLREVRLKTVPKLSKWAFYGCTNLSEVIFLRGKRLINQDFVARGLFSEEPGLLNQRSLKALVNTGRESAFRRCYSLTTVKISVSWALSKRMARLPQDLRLSVEERIRGRDRLEQMQDGNVFACFPVVNRVYDDEYDGYGIVRDPNLETARSLHQVLQLIAFHELKEASILIELAMWKSNIDGTVSAPRVDCRVPLPEPAKSLIMEYCGFAGFLVLSID